MTWYDSQQECDLTQWTEGDPLAVPPTGQIMEDMGSPSDIVMRRDSFSAKRTLVVAWDVVDAVARELLGGPELTGDLSYVIHRPGYYPGYPYAMVQEVSLEPVPGLAPTRSASDLNGVLNTYAAAKLHVTYGTRETSGTGRTGDTSGSQPDNPVLVTENFDGAVEMLALPTKNLRWDSGGQVPVDEGYGVGLILRLINWVVTWQHVMFVPSALFARAGTVSTARHYSPALGQDSLIFEPGTLMWGAPTVKREWSLYGYGAFEVTLPFAWKPFEWNKFIRPDTGDKTYMFYEYQGLYPVRFFYEKQDFSDLLPVYVPP